MSKSIFMLRWNFQITRSRIYLIVSSKKGKCVDSCYEIKKIIYIAQG